MSNVESKILGFRERATNILQRTVQYTTYIDNLTNLQPVTWKVQFAVPNLPFSAAMKVLEPELEAIIESLNRAIEARDYSGERINKVYQHVRPLFRIREETEGGRPVRRDGYVPGDPISYYLSYQFSMVLDYRNRSLLILENPYQDFCVRMFAGDIFKSHVLLNKEVMESASREVIEYAREFLRTAQRITQVDVEGIFMDYQKLLLGIHSGLADHTQNIVTYKGMPIRRVGPINTGVISSFISRDLTQTVPFDHLDLIRTKIESLRGMRGDVDFVKLVSLLGAAKDWGELLPDVIEYTHRMHLEPFDKHNVFELCGDTENPLEIRTVKREDIIGQDENVARLEKLVKAFIQGREIPFILLKGETGTGKTLTLKYLATNYPGLRLILFHSGYLGGLGNLAERYAKKPYHTLLYIDDMHLNQDPSSWEGFKTGTQGMKEWPKNVALVSSVNPRAFEGLPHEIRRRFPVMLDYKFEPNNRELLEKICNAHCMQLDVQYDPQLIDQITARFNTNPKELTPVAVYDFLKERKAIQGI